VIRGSYKKLAVCHHPDKGGDAGRFRQIQEAYEILSAPSARAEYDRMKKELAAVEDELQAAIALGGASVFLNLVGVIVTTIYTGFRVLCWLRK
jgi:curved DNA-binding protein CbpA